MKKLFLFLIALFLIAPAFSQIAYQQGDNQLNFGFNVGQAPGIYGSYEVGITDNISIGGEAAIGFVYTLVYFGYSSFQTNFRFSGFANYHFGQLIGLPDEWDVYGGADVGYSIWTKDSDVPNSTGFDDVFNWNENSIMIGAHGGGRWFWNDKWGVNAELGGGIGYFIAKGGLTMKL